MNTTQSPVDVHAELVERIDRGSSPVLAVILRADGGETHIIAIAPAIANAVYDAVGVRVRSMPIRSQALKQT